MHKYIFFLLLFPLQLLAVDASILPVSQEARAVFEILGFSRSFVAKAEKNKNIATIAVVRRAAPNADSAGRCPILISELQYQSTYGAIAGKIRAEVVDWNYAGKQEFKTLLSDKNAFAVYVCPVFDSELQEIAEVTRELRVLSILGASDIIANPLTVGLKADAQKKADVRISINLEASALENADFEARFLKMTSIH